MTVRILTPAQKDAIETIYKAGTKTQVEMAAFLKTSPRTINRVLHERGLIPIVPFDSKLSLQATEVMMLLYKHKVSIEQLKHLLASDRFEEHPDIARARFEKLMRGMSVNINRNSIGIYWDATARCAWAAWKESNNICHALKTMFKSTQLQTVPTNKSPRAHNHAQHLLQID